MSKKMLDELMKKAYQMQQQVAKVQEEMANRTVEATSGGGMVTVVANGKKEIVSIKIDPAVVNPDDAEMLEDLILSAAREAQRKAEELFSEGMKELTGGLNIPGLF